MGNKLTVANACGEPVWVEVFRNEFDITGGVLDVSFGKEPMKVGVQFSQQEISVGAVRIKSGEKFKFKSGVSTYCVTIRRDSLHGEPLCIKMHVERLHNIIITANSSIVFAKPGRVWQDEDGKDHEPGCQIKPVVHQLVESNISGETMTLDVALSKLIDITGSRKLAEWILQSMRSENIDRKHRENSSSDLTAYELELIVKNVENVKQDLTRELRKTGKQYEPTKEVLSRLLHEHFNLLQEDVSVAINLCNDFDD